MSLPHPRDVEDLDALAAQLDTATHEERVKWTRSLGQGAQRRLFRLAEGRPVLVDELVGEGGEVVRHIGRNGMPLFNRFEKRFARLGSAVVGYNHNEFGWPASWVVGPGHFLTYPSPDREGEVWIDYRVVPTERHPEFPPLRSNEYGLAALVFGNMVDVLRRVSMHVTIGDSFKNFQRSTPVPLLARIGSLLPTAPFVLCRV